MLTKLCSAKGSSILHHFPHKHLQVRGFIPEVFLSDFSSWLLLYLIVVMQLFIFHCLCTHCASSQQDYSEGPPGADTQSEVRLYHFKYAILLVDLFCLSNVFLAVQIEFCLIFRPFPKGSVCLSEGKTPWPFVHQPLWFKAASLDG